MDPTGLSADTAAVISLALEWGLYGFSTLMFGGTLWVLFFESSKVNYKMVSLACGFFVLGTAHALLDIVRMERGFVSDRNTFPGGPPAFFADVTQPMFVIRSIFYILQTLLGDGIVIYRCYVVWRSWKVVIFPAMLWLSVAVSGFGAMYTLSHAGALGSADIFSFAKWINSYFSLTLACNLISTGLLASRIWLMNKQSARFRTGRSPLLPTFRVVIDSGILYSITLTVALVTFVSKSNSQYIVLDMLMPIISISFYMIIIRLSLASRQSSSGGGGVSGGSSRSRHYDGEQYSLRPVQIHITKLSQTQKDPPNDVGNDALTNSDKNDPTRTADVSERWEHHAV